MLRRHAAPERREHGVAHLGSVVFDKRIREPDRDAFFAADHRPDQPAIARIQFRDARFLFDHFRPVHSEPRLPRHDEPGAERRRERHAAEASDHAADHADDRHMPAQRDDSRLNLGDCRQAQIRLLQAHAAGLEEDHRTDRVARFDFTERQFERRRDLRTRHLADASALKSGLDCGDDGRLAAERAACDHRAVVGLADDALHREPRRFELVERAEQFAVRARIEQRVRAFASRHFNETVPREKTLLRGHRVSPESLASLASLTSTASERRSMTTPGVAPKSFSSNFAAPS